LRKFFVVNDGAKVGDMRGAVLGKYQDFGFGMKLGFGSGLALAQWGISEGRSHPKIVNPEFPS
jgi:hypothetical protein